MDRLSAEQRRRNSLSRDTWSLYQSHRDRVTSLLLEALDGTACESVCILGAGNCNDVDLRELLENVDRIHLVDLDPEALANAVRLQGVENDPRIELHGEVDVTGVMLELSELGEQSTAENVNSVVELINHQLGLHMAPGCDLVASIGLLSQLIDAAHSALGSGHPSLGHLVAALRSQHFRQLAALSRPGGSVVLVTEIVSTDTAPELRTVDDKDLTGMLRSLVMAGNFFTGLNPAVLENELRTSPDIAARLQEMKFSSPWLWTFVARTYACAGFLVRLS